MPIEIETNADGFACFRVRIEPPLWIGVAPIVVPHSSAPLIKLMHVAPGSSLNPELTRRVLRVAFDLSSHLPGHWTLRIADAELEIETAEPLGEVNRAKVEHALEWLLGAVQQLARSAPVAPWRRALLQAWAAASVELGAVIEPEKPSLAYSRGGVRAEVSIELERGAPVTLVRIATELAPNAAAEPSAAANALAELGCEVRETGGALAVVRPGLVSSASALREILENAIALANDRRHSGPYR